MAWRRLGLIVLVAWTATAAAAPATTAPAQPLSERERQVDDWFRGEDVLWAMMSRESRALIVESTMSPAVARAALQQAISLARDKQCRTSLTMAAAVYAFAYDLRPSLISNRYIQQCVSKTKDDRWRKWLAEPTRE